MGRRGPKPKQPKQPLRQTDADEEEVDLDLKTFLSGLSGTDAVIKVYRVDRSVQKWKENLAPNSFSEAELLEKYGPGKFLLRPFHNNKFLPSITVDLEGPDTPAPTSPLQGYAGNGGGDPVLQMQLEMMKEQRAADKEHFNRMFDLLSSKVSVPAAAQPTIIDLIGGLQQLDTLRGGKAEGGSLVSQVKDMVELVDTLRPNKHGGDDDSMVGMIRELVPAFLEMKGRPATPIQRPTASLPARAAAAAAAAPTEQQPAIRPAPENPVVKVWNDTIDQARMEIASESWADVIAARSQNERCVGERMFVETILDEKTEFEKWWTDCQMKTDELKPWFAEFFKSVRDSFSDAPATEEKSAS